MPPAMILSYAHVNGVGLNPYSKRRQSKTGALS